MNFIRLEFKADAEKTEIITACLMDEGFEGIEEVEGNAISYIREKDFDEASIKKLFDKYELRFDTLIVPEINWNAEWEANFQPVQVEDFVNIRASFHPALNASKHDIIINPKMSFGTGHHATTWMMMDQMKELDFTGKQVIDFGTGTGILAILAEKLGATGILAVDNDNNCIENATENISVNECKKVKLLMDNIVSHKADIILANINKNIILSNLPNIASSLKKEGKILLSGLLKEDYDEINESIIQQNFKLLYKTERENWICLLYTSV